MGNTRKWPVGQNPRKEAKQLAARLRKDDRNLLTSDSQIVTLNKRLGIDKGAKKERTRITKICTTCGFTRTAHDESVPADSHVDPAAYPCGQFQERKA